MVVHPRGGCREVSKDLRPLRADRTSALAPLLRSIQARERLVTFPVNSTWWLYVLCCNDNSLYCGVTTDVERRMWEHSNGRGSRYVNSKRPFTLLLKKVVGNYSQALREEAKFKKLSLEKKLEYIDKGQDEAISKEVARKEAAKDNLHLHSHHQNRNQPGRRSKNSAGKLPAQGRPRRDVAGHRAIVSKDRR